MKKKIPSVKSIDLNTPENIHVVILSDKKQKAITEPSNSKAEHTIDLREKDEKPTIKKEDPGLVVSPLSQAFEKVKNLKKIHFSVRPILPESFHMNISSLGIFLWLGGFTCVSLIGIAFGMHLVRAKQEISLYKNELTGPIASYSLQSITRQDFVRLSLNLLRAREIFQKLQSYIPPENTALGVGNSYVGTLNNALKGAELIAEAGDGASDVMDNVSSFLQDMKILNDVDLKNRYKNLSTFLLFQWRYLEINTFDKLREANVNLQKIQADLFPSDVASQLTELKKAIAQVIGLIDEAEYLFPKFLSLIGEDYPRTYVVLLQNSSEARATGGFIGSLAFVSFNDGWIKNITFKDVYEFDGQFFQDVPPPPGIEKISAQFRLRDANYWPDFPTSAKQIAWFLDKEKGPGVDGVFAVTDTFIKDLLELTGPISLPDVGVPVSKDNFSQLISFLVESKVDKAQPKSVLFAFADEFLKKVKPVVLEHKGVNLILKNMKERQILAFSFHDDIQSLFSYFGVDGTMYDAATSPINGIQDYLLVAHTAIGANKSDQYIEEKISHETQVTDAGEIMDHVVISRRHLWNDALEEKLFSFLEKVTGKKVDNSVAFILGKGNNADYIRIYVPEGSEIQAVDAIKREDIETYQDLGKTVFAFVMNVVPGEEKHVTIKYKLPDTLSAKEGSKEFIPYYLVLEKQPGGKNIEVQHTVSSDSSWVVAANDEHSITQNDLDTSLLIPAKKVLLTSRELISYLFFMPRG
ncbi:MAG: DUF4012 domain-containing protein [Candidatus Gracilibacteria bacterium]